MLPKNYYGNVNHDLLALIPPDAKTVLEIGCGEGALCEAYRRVNPWVKWIGVEPHNAACDVAAARVTSLLRITAEELEWKLSPCEGYDDIDCLIFGDVLEHLTDPWATLKMIAKYIRPGAQVLASIPNVQHYTMIYSLLTGCFAYADHGLFDRTHLRWFTRKTIKAMFEDAGLQVFEMRGIKGLAEGKPDDAQWACWQGEVSKLAIQGIDLRDMRALQYVVRAVKPSVTIEPIPKLHIHAIEAEDCCARPRIREPFAMLVTIPGVRCTTNGQYYAEPFPDVLIQQRYRALQAPWGEGIHCQRFLAERMLLIAEIDDDPTSPVYLDGATFDPMVFKAVHAVQCSTEAIAEIVRQWNPNVMVFPNQIAELPPLRDLEQDEGDYERTIRIFFGAQNRENDWKPIVGALNQVLADYVAPIVFEVVHDREFYDALPGGPIINKHFHHFLPYDQYRRLLRSCDIALLPLEDTPFNRCKSDIKFLECAAEGVVPLMSLTACRAIGEGDCGIGMFWNEVNPFELCLRQLIENEHGGRRLLAEKYYRYVRDNRLLGQHFRKRYEWYQSLLSSKPVLDRSLLERVPEFQSSLAPA